MKLWDRYEKKQQQEYIHFLRIYGGMSRLFRQKGEDQVPHLDSKFQETVFARAFKSETVDISNTPHDILSVFGSTRIGVGIKTWMGTSPTFQKVMQIKSHSNELLRFKKNHSDLIYQISELRNQKLKSDYNRLGLSEEGNVYHYVSRSEGRITINECPYTLVNLDRLTLKKGDAKSVNWSDGRAEYRFTFSDSQIHRKFGTNQSEKIESFTVKIISDPFSFLLRSFEGFAQEYKTDTPEIEEVFLPLYSYRTGEVEEKSGLNAWNAAPKNKGSSTPRPLNEVYIPIPAEFHKKFPKFFTKQDIHSTGDEEIRFHLNLPNGKKIPALITQSGWKSLQSGSLTDRDENGRPIGQAALGQWLLVDVLGLKERKKVTREWLEKRDTDCIRIWKTKGDFQNFNIDIGPLGAFDAFMNGESTEEE